MMAEIPFVPLPGCWLPLWVLSWRPRSSETAVSGHEAVFPCRVAVEEGTVASEEPLDWRA
jgi:hypothetical protein